jgi:CDP-glucose 4,6-dehydratase
MDKIILRNALNSFKGKKVFITGHTGFKGSWLSFILNEVGAEVMGYALDPIEGPSHFNMLNLSSKINHVVGDVRDAAKLDNAMHKFQPEYVFHLAAQALVKKSYDDPVNTFDTNIMGSVNLLDSVRRCSSVLSLVYITSDKCYENLEWIWGYRETDRLGGHDPYSASKGAAEIIFSAYLRSFFESGNLIGAASTRAGNVIGGGDWAVDRIIPDCIRSIEKNVPIKIRNPLATRPWQHVLEPLSGYILLSAKLRDDPKKFSGSWNFGPSSSEVRTVNEVASKIIHHLGKGKIEITGASDQHHEAMLLQLNCDKSHQILKWEPRWHVEETLKYTAEWYKKVLDGESAEDITKLQVDKYFN